MSDSHSTSDTERLCREVIDQYEDDWEDFKNGEDGALNYLIGRVMQLSGGSVNPAEAAETFRSLQPGTDRDLQRIADEIEDAAIGSIGEDRNTGGATMVPRDKLLGWADELRSLQSGKGRRADQ